MLDLLNMSHKKTKEKNKMSKLNPWKKQRAIRIVRAIKKKKSNDIKSYYENYIKNVDVETIFERSDNGTFWWLKSQFVDCVCFYLNFVDYYTFAKTEKVEIPPDIKEIAAEAKIALRMYKQALILSAIQAGDLPAIATREVNEYQKYLEGVHLLDLRPLNSFYNIDIDDAIYNYNNF
jgi:hypothetical protein